MGLRAVFGRKRSIDQMTLDPSTRAMEQTLARMEGDDPDVRVRVGGHTLERLMLDRIAAADGGRVHVETLFTLCGALGGFACAAIVWGDAGGDFDRTGLHAVRGADSQVYCFGDPVNTLLCEHRYSLWGLVAGSVQSLGGDVPDLEPMLRTVAATVGSDAFDRVPLDPAPILSPLTLCRLVWPQAAQAFAAYPGRPGLWPAMAGDAFARLVHRTRDVIPPSRAARYTMEAACRTSKVHPGRILD